MKATKMLIFVPPGSKGSNFNFLEIFQNHFKSLGKCCESHL